jgi:hypothetical protein
VAIKSTIFWDITPCSPLSVNRRFGGTYRIHFQGRKNKLSKKPAISRWQKKVFISVNSLGTSQRLVSVPQINTILLLGAPMLPTWWVKISTCLQSERFLSIIFYNLEIKLLIIFKALVLNPYVHVLCSS